MKIIQHEEWKTLGKKLFGDNQRKWKFVCPNCGHVQTAQEFLDIGVDWSEISSVWGYTCVGVYHAMDREQQQLMKRDTGVALIGEKDRGKGCIFIGSIEHAMMPLFVQKGVTTYGGEEVPVGFPCMEFAQ